jgi:glycosyltransferase involved in cell wall biosynthesis
MAKAKIAILGTRGIPAKYGGFETFCEELSIRLAEAGFEVAVYCEADEGKADETYRGVRLVYVRRFRLGPLTTILFDVACFWKARKHYDLVYMLGYGAAFFAWFPRLWDARTWINMDGVEWARTKWSYLARQWFKVMEWTSMRTPNRIIADAESIRSHLQRRHGDRKACAVIAYGAYPVSREPDRSLLGAWGLESGNYYLVVCRLEPENHVLEILRGFARSATRRRMVVVGDIRDPGTYVATLMAIQDTRIQFIGTVFDKEKLACLRFHCHAYFHGHSVGGTNPSLLEAMGCGNLVIAHDNGFNREVLRETGLFFRDEEAIPGTVARIEAQGFTSETFRAGARKRIVDFYSWDRIAGQYAELIAEDLRIPRKPQP